MVKLLPGTKSYIVGLKSLSLLLALLPCFYLQVNARWLLLQRTSHGLLTPQTYGVLTVTF